MSSSDNFRIEYLQADELDKVATLLTDAFETNPAYALIFTEKKELREGLFWLFKTNLFLINRRIPITKVVKEKGTGEIVGVFGLVPPGGVKTTFRDHLQIGLPQFILKFGFRTLRKMIGMDSYNKQLLTNAIGTKNYYYLSAVAIKKEYQGKCIGSFMIKNSLDELRSVQRTCHIIGLTTQLPENVTFYSRLGFQKLDEGEVCFKQDCYYNYTMKLDL